MSSCLKHYSVRHELNTLDACWIAVDVWSNSSRCRQESVYLSRTWCLYTWSCLDNLIIIRFSINCSTVICSPTVYLLSWEKTLVNTTAPGSIHIHRLHLRFYFALLLCCFQFSLGKQSIRDWQPLHSVGSRFFVFVQDLVLLLHLVDTLVLKLREILISTLLHHPFLFKGKPTQCSRGRKKDFWRRCRGVYTQVDIPSTHHKPLSPALHYLPFASRFPLPHFTLAVLFALFFRSPHLRLSRRYG